MLAPAKIRKRSNGGLRALSGGTGPTLGRLAQSALSTRRDRGGSRAPLALLHDLHAHAGADAVRPRLEHGLRGLEVAHAARGLHAHVRPDHAAHERDVGGGGAAGAEAGGGLHEVGARRLGERRRPCTFSSSVSRAASMMTLTMRAAAVAGLHHARDVPLAPGGSRRT